MSPNTNCFHCKKRIAITDRVFIGSGRLCCSAKCLEAAASVVHFRVVTCLGATSACLAMPTPATRARSRVTCPACLAALREAAQGPA